MGFAKHSPARAGRRPALSGLLGAYDSMTDSVQVQDMGDRGGSGHGWRQGRMGLRKETQRMPWMETCVVDRRTEFVLRAYRNVERFDALCREFGISRKTGYKWKERFLRDGVSGLGDRSRRPSRSPQEVGEAMVCQIVKLRTAHPRGEHGSCVRCWNGPCRRAACPRRAASSEFWTRPGSWNAADGCRPSKPAVCRRRPEQSVPIMFGQLISRGGGTRGIGAV